MQISAVPEPIGNEAGSMPASPFLPLPLKNVLRIWVWRSREEDVLGAFPWWQALATDFMFCLFG